jgi:hypothetical protein
MKLDCFCWSLYSIASLDKLLLTLVLKHACAEARLCWSTLVLKHACAEARWSIVSDETWLFLLRPLIDCLARQASSEALVRLLLLELDKLLVRFLLLKPLLDCFHWGLNVPVEAAIRLLLLERCSIASFDELLQRPLFDCFARQASASACAEARLCWGVGGAVAVNTQQMGGAIDNGGFLSVSRSHFKDSATAAGGTIYCGKCELEVVESRFGRNKETNVPAAIASTEAWAAVRLRFCWGRCSIAPSGAWLLLKLLFNCSYWSSTVSADATAQSCKLLSNVSMVLRLDRFCNCFYWSSTSCLVSIVLRLDRFCHCFYWSSTSWLELPCKLDELSYNCFYWSSSRCSIAPAGARPLLHCSVV